MAKRVGGFVVHNQEIKERWEKLMALQEEGANLTDEPTALEPDSSSGTGEGTNDQSGPEPGTALKPEPNPCEAEPDPHADIGEPVLIIKVVRGQ